LPPSGATGRARYESPPFDPVVDVTPERPNPDARAAAEPARVPVLPVRSTVVFPFGATALQMTSPPNVEALAHHTEPDLVVAVVTTLDDDVPVDPASLNKIAGAARVLDRLNLSGGTVQVTIQGLRRVRLTDVRYADGYYTGVPEPVEEPPADEADAERLMELILTTLDGVAARVERISDEAPRILRNNLADPGRFADLVATLCHFSIADRDEVLQTLDVTERLDLVLGQLQATWDRICQIDEERESAERERSGGTAPARRDRPAEIRNRIRMLRAQLGETDPAERETLEVLRRIDRAQLPTRVAAAARREAERLRTVDPAGSEAAEIRGWLDTLLAVAWSDGHPPLAESIDLDAVRSALDEAYLGREDVKRRILEVLSVAKLRGNVNGLVPCLVGPPGVGKRSLAEAIARGLDRPLARVELGGAGEAQLVGSRRTRSGARPGRILTVLQDAGVSDPVLLFEELDEVGRGNVEGDPVEAMEEVLDPETRADFVDRYLDLAVDLSRAALVATANDFYRIPYTLRDFLIEIRVAGYTPEEKVEIARKRLLPRYARAHGLDPDAIEVSDETLLALARGHARDAGLGNLRRAISALLRRFALQQASGEASQWTISPELIEEVLGPPRYQSTPAESQPEVGVVTGLAWTASGGELLFIEALRMPGTGRLIITGLPGEVMRESVNAAYSYVRSRADALGISHDAFGETDVHIHFPAGATPKDGPSAGVAVTLAIASSLSDRPVRHDVAMTGEVTLRGKVLEIGGVKEKVLAAYRAGLREVILPEGNERDLRDVPDDVREHMRFHFVSRMDEVLDLALLQRPEPAADGSTEDVDAGSGEAARERQVAAQRDAP
jgi:ATP-dependent Lon protease